jgi:hypothetical protein
MDYLDVCHVVTFEGMTNVGAEGRTNAGINRVCHVVMFVMIDLARSAHA